MSATALIGLLVGFKFVIVILDLSLTILPFHLLGLKGLMGEIDNFFEFKFKIGPWTERLYAVLPAGVDTNTPSPISFFIICFWPTEILSEAVCLLCLKTEISLTAINSILCVITVPVILIISLSLLGYGGLNEGQSLLNVAFQMFLIVTIPVILGVLLSSFLSSFEKIAKNISIILFALVLLGAIISQRENVISYFAQAGLVMLFLNVIMMIIVYFLSRSFNASKETFRCWLMEVGLQNGTLAIVVANTFFASTVYLIPAAIYSLIMYATALPLIYFLRRN